ncbi:flagellin [Cytobacillus sp.]|uniref:flagellin N-terminal helical domain-containing protein n=1 Tax=Cytobacillus sp. TaxID=2675269 RepID=UPI0035131CF4
MIINNNIPALNTYRQMGANQKANANAMEKLSSGLRINKAGDDAAGLAISEKMRAQVRGLDQASRNSQDGISMIQTAEGALQETQNILQRMRELATQAANDTNVEVDRAEIQKEMNALTSEINRIGETTEFNTQKILKGDGSAVKEVGALELDKTGVIAQTALQGGKVEAATAAKMQLSLGAGDGADELNGESFTFEFNGNSVKLDIKTVATAGEEGANTFEVKDGGNEVTLTLVAGDDNQKFIMSKMEEALKAAITENANIDESNYTFSRDEAVLSVNSVSTGEGESISVTGATGNDSLTANLGPTAATSTAQNALGNSEGFDTASSITINGETVTLTQTATLGAAYDAAANKSTVVTKLQEDIDNSLGEGKYTVSVGDDDKLTITSVEKGSAAAVVVAGTSEALLGFGTDVEVAGTAGTFNDVVGTKQEVSGDKEVRTRASATIDSFTATNLKDQIIASGIASDNSDYFASGNVTDEGAEKFLNGKGFTIGDETVEFFNSNESAYKGTADHAVDLALVNWDSTSGSTNVDTYDMEALVSSIVSQIGNKMENVTLSDTSTAGVAAQLTVTAKEPGIAGNSIEVNDAASREASDVVGSTFEATFQIGANTGQSMTIQVGDMRAQALGVSGGKEGSTVTAKNGTEASYVKTANVTNGTNNDNVEFALDVSTHEKASASISVINDAIEKVSAQRSDLGAFQNRLEHTISNLGSASENLSAAESRIRDVDMAKEVMEMTRTNILSQASQAMLAQANQKPQSVLQLLG